MPRLFNVEVFNQTIGKNGVYSSSDFYALLGSAVTMTVQIIVDATTQASTTVSVSYQYNNTTQEQLWISPGWTTTVPVTTINDTPEQNAFGRFKVSADQPGASVRIIACGRSFQDPSGRWRSAMKSYEILPAGMAGSAKGGDLHAGTPERGDWDRPFLGSTCPVRASGPPWRAKQGCGETSIYRQRLWFRMRSANPGGLIARRTGDRRSPVHRQAVDVAVRGASRWRHRLSMYGRPAVARPASDEPSRAFARIRGRRGSGGSP